MLKRCNINFLYSLKVSEKTLKFDNIEFNKKEFHASNQAVGLSLLDTDKVAISDKFKYGNNGFKYFIGHKDDNNIAWLLRIILP